MKTGKSQVKHYAVYGCGGDRDGELILETTDLSDAINRAYKSELAYPLGCFILDDEGKEIEW